MHASFEHRHSVLASTTAVALDLPKTKAAHLFCRSNA